MASVTTILVFDLNRKPATPDPSDEEIQDAKLLYYYPEYRGVEERRSHAGFIEGLIGMLASFTTHKIDFMRTKHFITTILEWCKDVYLVVCFKNGESNANEMRDYSHHWKNFITKVVLENGKNLFELVYGPLGNFLGQLDSSPGTLEQLRLAFENVLVPFIIQSTGNSLHILSSWNASHKSQVNAECALEAEFMIQGLSQKFEAIKDFLLICDEQVIHSSLELNDKLLLYVYLLKHQGKICENMEFRLKKTENEQDKVHIMECEAGTVFIPSIHIRGQKRNLGIIRHGSIYLILLLQAEDASFTLSNIKEYVAGLPQGLQPLINAMKKEPKVSMDRTISLNKETRTIRSVGYEKLDVKELKELHIIHGIHQLITSGDNGITSGHFRNINGWISAKSSNGREVYRVIENGNMPLTGVKDSFHDFIKQHLGGIYFV